MPVDTLTQQIMDLRQKTGAGFMDCKKALAEAGGQVDEALAYLRKKGIADAAKRVGRATGEGLVAYAVQGKAAALIELNCETDFVAKNQEFKRLSEALASDAAGGTISSPEAANSRIEPIQLSMKENIRLRRLERFVLPGPGLLAGYIHLDGKKGALIEIKAFSDAAAASDEIKALAKELLLQIVGSSARYLSKESVPAAEISREREIFTEQVRAEGKPEAAIAKIVDGKVQKLFYQSQCLLEQMSLRDGKVPVAQLVADVAKKLGGAISVARFARYQLGE
jgi:elongation factor Ts